MMGIVGPKTCWASKKYNKIIVASSWFLFFSYHNDAQSNTHQKLHSLLHHKMETVPFDCSINMVESESTYNDTFL